MKYIDVECLRATIEKRVKSIESCHFIEAEFGALEKREGRIQAYYEILILIESLQQEQPEVDLEKEIMRYQREDMDRDTTVKDVARHFYELGQLVMKHSITNRAKVALAKCHSFPNTTYFAIGEVLSFILDRTDTEHEKEKED